LERKRADVIPAKDMSIALCSIITGKRQGLKDQIAGDYSRPERLELYAGVWSSVPGPVIRSVYLSAALQLRDVHCTTYRTNESENNLVYLSRNK
jgi:hypothetical protein